MFNRNRRRTGKPSIVTLVLQRIIYSIPFGQNGMIIAAAISLAVIIFSGFILYRQYDQTDLMSKGEWLMRQGKAAQAVKAYESIATSNPGNYEAQIALGKSYLEINEPVKAARTFEKAAKIGAKSHNPLKADMAVAQYLIAQGYYQDAHERLVKAYKKMSKGERKSNKPMRATMLTLYQNWGDHLFKTDSQENIETAVQLYTRALIFTQNQQETDRVQSKLSLAFEKALSVYDVNNQQDKALKMAESVVKVDKSINTLLLAGEIQQKAGHAEKALEYFKAAYQINASQAIMPLMNLLEEKLLAYRQEGKNIAADRLSQTIKKLAKTNRLTWKEPPLAPTIDTEITPANAKKD